MLEHLGGGTALRDVRLPKKSGWKAKPVIQTDKITFPVDNSSSDAAADAVGGFEEEERGVLGVKVGGGGEAGESASDDNNRGLGVWREWGFWGVDSCLER
ncbi:phytoene dehydrogenase [Pyrus ussuriensis x Pyrus communis]|uniref:Phytoene dehydrogenase n=1 Tax=Pyrus ussuriensis x Pyrus communis TaxID=2448454 RepID=A0A5N5H3L9_9ROSA|nr:phytoene dehydrogenase [Pyrus ussuriensis x Pyrus communis]